MNPLQADVAIIGAGIAGLTCALELLEHGQRRVLIIDRDQPERLGGLARESFGGMFAVDTPEQRRAGIRDSIDLAWADWQSFAEFEPDAVWPRQWAHAYVTHCTEHMYLWLRGRGARYFPVPNWVERGLYTPGNSVPRFHMVWGTGEKLVLALLTQLEPYLANGALQLRCGLRVDALEQEGGQVVGCRGVANDSGSAFTVSAGQVVIAGGGINGGDLSRVRAHWHRDWRVPPELILNGSHRYADGTLHDAAQALGGRITHLDKQWNYAAGVHHYASSKPLAGLSLVPPKSALWLNWRGQRIGPQPLVSGYDTRDLVRQVCAQERGYSWMLLNQRIALKELAVSGAEHNPSIRDQHWLAFLRDILLGNRWLLDTMLTRCVDFVQADTLPELAARMNALQGDDAVDVLRAVGGQDLGDVLARGAHAGEVRRGLEARGRDVHDGRQGLVARGAAGAVGDAEVLRREFAELLHDGLELLDTDRGVRWEEFKRNSGGHREAYRKNSRLPSPPVMGLSK